jgi:YHS domain-containing protein
MLRITVHDKPGALTFQLEGRLAGPWVRELEACWQGARAGRRKPTLRVDLTGVTSVDAAGQACLAALHRQGAEFVAADCLTKAVVAEITSTVEGDQLTAQEDYPMTNVDALINRIDHEVAAEVERQRAAWAEAAAADRERGLRLKRYETAARHVIELLKPRLHAFAERFKAVVQAEPVDRAPTRAVTLRFQATVATARLTFEVSPDQDVRQVRLECVQEIIPVLVPCDRRSVFEFPPDAVPDDAVVRWFDDRLVAFVKSYLALVRQDPELREQLKEQLVEDPVARIRFPKHLASSTLERDGRTYYFVGEDTRREFERRPAGQPGRE